MSTTRTTDCRKFSPNIFNKSKCSHCFRQREEHSAAALECNRASRKVSKCGYLFVAPDWDFSNPLYRTKRWQRRWFVLYDDGELTYSVDEHPETVPQASIDMTKVIEVATAEDVTGHSNSVAITAPDRVTFVKGTCPEESKWWFNILVAFPKSKGRHKRHATFPGAQTPSSKLQSTNSDASSKVGVPPPTISTPKSLPTTPIAVTARNRHNSFHQDGLTSGVLIGGVGGTRRDHCDDEDDDGVIRDVAEDEDVGDSDDDDEDDGVETGEDEDDDDDDDVTDEQGATERSSSNTTATTNGGGQDENNRNAGNEITSKVSPPCLLIEDIRHDKKTIKDIENTIKNLSQQQKVGRWSTTAVNNALNSHLHHNESGNAGDNSNNKNSKNSHDETDFSPLSRHRHSNYHNHQQQQQQHQQQKGPRQTTTIVNLRPKSLPLASNSTPAIVSAIVKKIPPVMVTKGGGGGGGDCNTQTTQSSSTSTTTGGGGDSNNNINNNNNNNHNKNKSSPRLQLQLKQQQQKQQQQLNHHHHHQHNHHLLLLEAHERGDPDGGCNLDDLSTNYLAKTAELRVVKPSSSAVDSPVDPLEQSSGGSLLNAKKGWLMKQDNRSGDWTKHWFTLSGAALFFYRDPVSEERGVLDGVLDVNSLTQVSEVSASKSYAFQLTTWDKRRLTLASLSPNSRSSWIAVLRNAAGLSNSATQSAATEIAKKDSATTELIIKDPSSSDDDKTEIEKDFIKAQRLTSNSGSSNNNKEQPNDPSPQMLVVSSLTNVSPTGLPPLKGGTASLISPITPSTPKIGHFSSDEEYRTASEGGRRDSIDWGSPLSPSPPIPLSLLRAKERMSSRGINYPRLHKRSRSSPPSSRRSTVDSVGSDDMPPLIQPVQEELNLDKELQFRLSVAEKERNILQEEAKEREARMSELLRTLERTEQELNARIHEMEEVRENLTSQLEDAKRNAEEIVDRLTDELDESQRKVKDLEDRLTRGIDENETLYKRLRELESCSPSAFGNLNRSKLKRLDSLSDLTQISDIDPFHLERDSLAEEYNELRSRFEKAVNEIKAMKRELKESQNQFDSLEISYATLKKDLERKDVEDRSQLSMMAARIQDLTQKYSNSERQVRTLKQKLAKAERRRSLSLKGKEQLSVSKELEMKLSELEAKIEEMEKSSVDSKTAGVKSAGSANSNIPGKKSSSRRRSLESAAHSDSVQFLVRVSDLEKRCDAGSSSPSTSQSTATPPTVVAATSATPKMSEHLFDRLRSLENVLIASKDRLEHSLQQLQTLRSSRTRRSVSPIADRKDSYRYVERSIAEVVKLIRESCDTCVISRSCGGGASPSLGPTAAETASPQLLPETNPVKSSLTQLEAQLRAKLADLLKKRRMLRERNELTKRKDLELLAERVAYESVCFGKLRDSVARAENPELFGERQTRAEVAETSHLMTMLKAKLSGKCAALKANGSVDVLAGVLARRLLLSSYHRKEAQQQQPLSQPPATPRHAMEPVDQNILDDLLRQQNELCVIVKRYKNNAMENLATGLAAETLSYISSNDLVQGAVQEAWRQAQETVNAELVQSEIAHIMMRNAERFESAITPAFGYTLTAAERLSFEKFADAVHDTLRREMEAAVAQLTGCYEQAIQKMKRGQWRMHMEQERKASEGRQLLAEFADIVAHKALVDARIAVLCGDYNDNSSVSETGDHKAKVAGLTALQRYERLFEELSHDLQIDHPDEMLAEADFEFMYKQHTVEFLNDRQVLADISSFLGQLEDSLIALQCEAATVPAGIARSAISIESLEDVCHKCCDLRQRADQLLQDVHRKLNTPCQHCHQVREKLCSLQQQHDSEMMHLQQSHAQDLTALMQQAENQRNALRNLEAEKNAINGDLHRSEELLEERERELAACKAQLRAKEAEMCDQHELRQRLDEGEEKCRAAQEESDALTVKCARQDEEYAVLLQERDFLQAELGKERERSRRFEKRLELLEAEHSKQLECLQEAYRDQMLAHCPEFGGGSQAGDDESFRLRYQTEIEQLRTLCEKGLSAMESSHRRIISDLEEKHREEIERLLLEKETALAEETQATLAALDAMRKAHQSEVQREVARFKQEFLKQVHRGELSHDGTKANEEELEELRLEILSFSEKYSIKCVENAALEEKLRSANQKLKHFQQMQQIELRSKQFRAHLASDDPKSEASFVQGLLPAAKVGEDGVEACEDSESKLHALEETTIREVAVANEPNQQQQRGEQQQKQQLEQKVAILHSSSRSAATATKTAPTAAAAAAAAASSLSSISPFVSMKAISNDVEKLVKKPNVARFPIAAVRAAVDEDLNQVHHDLHHGEDEDRKQVHDDDPESVDEVVVAANKPVDAHDKHIDDGDDHIDDNKDDDDHDHDDNDDDDDDDDVQRRYSYEPCYKPANLYNSYANRLSFQGLNLKSSSTFGKNLKKARKVVEKSATTATTQKSQQQQRQYNKTTSPASSKVVPPATATTMLTLTSKSSNSEQKETNAKTVKNITTTPTTTTMHCITPVEQPKNFSANKHVNYKNINNNHLRPLRHEPSSTTTTTTAPTTPTTTSNLHNSNLHNNVYFNYLNLKRPPTTNEEATPTKLTSSSSSNRAASNDPLQIIKYNNILKNNNNTNNTHNNNNNKILMKNMKISEKSAINLESFTQIIHNTPVASKSSNSSNRRRRLQAATTLPSINQDDDDNGGSDDDDDGDVGGDENVVEGDDCDDNGDVHDNVVVDTNKTTVVANDINTTNNNNNNAKNNNNNNTHNEDINGDFVKKQLKRDMPDDGGCCNRRASESTQPSDQHQAAAHHEEQRWRRQYCSPPPLNGRDVEHSRFTLTATATTESAKTTTKPTTNQTITDNKTSATIVTTPKATNLKKFELEI